VLIELKFSDIFIKRVMACVTSVQFKVHLNGKTVQFLREAEDFVKVTHSPPFFLLYLLEYLSRLMHKISNRPGFQFHPNCRYLKITHLMFADDLIIFCKAETLSLLLIFQALKIFYECVGLKTNLQKSQIIFEVAPNIYKTNACVYQASRKGPSHSLI